MARNWNIGKMAEISPKIYFTLKSKHGKNLYVLYDSVRKRLQVRRRIGLSLEIAIKSGRFFEYKIT